MNLEIRTFQEDLENFLRERTRSFSDEEKKEFFAHIEGAIVASALRRFLEEASEDVKLTLSSEKISSLEELLSALGEGVSLEKKQETIAMAARDILEETFGEEMKV